MYTRETAISRKLPHRGSRQGAGLKVACQISLLAASGCMPKSSGFRVSSWMPKGS